MGLPSLCVRVRVRVCVKTTSQPCNKQYMEVLLCIDPLRYYTGLSTESVSLIDLTDLSEPTHVLQYGTGYCDRSMCSEFFMNIFLGSATRLLMHLA